MLLMSLCSQANVTIDPTMRVNGEPSLFVDRQMALLCNSDIHSTGSSIVYMLIFDCLGN